MPVYLDLPTLFDLFCIAQGLTTAAVLFWRGHHPANRWLAWLMLGLTLQVLDYFLSLSGVYAQHKWLYFLPLFYSWSFGPLLCGYVRARQNATARRPGAPAGAPERYQLPRWYFAPVAMQALFYALLMAQSLDTKAWFWIQVHKPYTRYVEYYVAAGLVLWAIYKSQGFTITDRWLRRLLAGLALFYGVAIIEPLLNHLYLPAGWPKFWLTTLFLPCFVYTLALAGMLYDRARKPERNRSGVPGTALERAPLSAPTATQRERLLTAIRQQQLFKDPDLTLTSLAQHLGETPNTVSHVLNAGVGQSFNDFINTYRVEEVKRRMAAGDAGRVTLLGLAFDAGFASKTTFNRVFKEQTGQTPKEYLKNTSQPITWDDATA